MLFRLSDAAGAAQQFREAIRLDGKDAATHANLGEALFKLGDREQAASEYNAACALAPDNKALKARLEQLLQPVAEPPSPPATAIKVDVRQVLVPVIVTGADGHTVAGLRQEDFRVFEDGVEQKLAAFSVERSEETTAAGKPAGSGPGSPAEAAGATKLSEAARSYVVAVDALHTEFAHLGRVRDALAKSFGREEGRNAQYALVAVGNQTEVLQQSTRDPAAILAALEKHKFAGLTTRGHGGADAAQLDMFRRAVAEVRRSCDLPDLLERAKCDAGKSRILAQAEMLAQRAHFDTVNYLHQLRALVENLAGMPGRRTLVLVSDGFPLRPGMLSFGLIAAQFPELGFAGLRGMDRLQSDFEPVVRIATTNNIPIYTVDSRGLYASPAFDASTHGDASPRMDTIAHADRLAEESGNTLAEMAEATGGMFIHDTNDMSLGVERVLTDGRYTYMLAYVSSKGTLDGKFRAITVTLSDTKLNVRAKRGYWAAPEAP